MRVNRPWLAILWTLFVLTVGYSGCTCPDRGPKPPQPSSISPAERRTLLNNYLCPQVAKEDAENDGLRNTGKRWTLADLIFHASAAYAKEQLQSDDVTRARRMMAAMLAPEPPSISLAELCHRSGNHVRSKNQVVDEPLAAALAIASM